MNRIALRRILPVVQLALFLALVSIGSIQKNLHYAEMDAANSAQTEHLKKLMKEKGMQVSGERGLDLRNMIDADVEHITAKIAYSINAPSVFMSAVVGFPLLIVLDLIWPGSDPLQYEWPWIFIVALFVVISWYGVGRWLDSFLSTGWRVKLSGRAALIRIVILSLILGWALFRALQPWWDAWLWMGLALWCAMGLVVQAIRAWQWYIARAAE